MVACVCDNDRSDMYTYNSKAIHVHSDCYEARCVHDDNIKSIRAIRALHSNFNVVCAGVRHEEATHACNRNCSGVRVTCDIKTSTVCDG